MGTSVSYQYDDSGIRTQKIVNDVATNYYLNGNQIVTQLTDGARLDFFYDEKGDLFGFNYNGANYYYIRNGQNDIIGILDSTGTQVVSYQYDTWGKLLGISGSQASGVGTLNPFRYRGYYYDTETGLYSLLSRYYDPNTGRFLNADSDVGAGSDILAANVFAYCNNNPVMRSDPSGQWSLFNTFCVCLAVTVLIVCVLQPELIPAAAAALAEYGGAIAAGIGIGGAIVAEEATPEIEEAAPVVEETGQNIVKSPAVQQGLGKLADVAAKGKAGEAMSGIEKNYDHIESITNTAKYRIPDGLTKTVLSEVKNYSGTLSYTRQLQDFVAYSQANSLEMRLFTNANLSGSLQALVNGGTIKLFPLG